MILDYFSAHLYSFWFALGFLMLAIELLLFGLSTGFVMFLGFAALVTGGLLWFEWIPVTWQASAASFSICAVVISLLLWGQFKRLQKADEPVKPDTSSDLIGLQFRLGQDITTTEPGSHRYSGIEWRVEIDIGSPQKEIEAGSAVEVVSVSAGKFSVRALGS